jgi:hypothetical protein
MNNHKSSIRLGKDDDRDCTLLYSHFKRPDHSPNTLQFTILEKWQDKHCLEITETQWMWKLKSITPHGLNTYDGFKRKPEKSL